MILPEGYFNDSDQRLLGRVVAAAPAGTILEVGVYRGRSAHVIAMNLDPVCHKLSLCDNFMMGDHRETWPQAEQLIGDPRDVVPADREYALIHHDGPHDYEGARQHLEFLVPLVMEGGFLAVHDYYDRKSPGVKVAVDEILGKTGGFLRVSGEPGSLLSVHRRTRR